MGDQESVNRKPWSVMALMPSSKMLSLDSDKRGGGGGDGDGVFGGSQLPGVISEIRAQHRLICSAKQLTPHSQPPALKRLEQHAEARFGFPHIGPLAMSKSVDAKGK